MAPGTDVAVVVPRRADGGHRDQVWAELLAWYAAELPEVRVVEGHHDDGPFNRSAAINAGVDAAGPHDVLVIADADSWVDPEQLRTAVSTSAATGQLVLAYDLFCYLSRTMSAEALAGFAGSWWPGVEWSLDWSVSSMVVVPAPLWAEMGGADEGFVGWGGEDFALFHALDTLGGGHHRTLGPVWHFWHPPALHDSDDVFPARQKLYADAAGDRDAMLALLEQLRTEVPA